MVAAAAGGAGTGILAGLTGGLVGGAAIEAGASAIAAGAAGGAAGGASAGVTTGAVGLATGNETWTEAGENAVLDTAVGAGAGVVGVWGAGPVQGGWNFDPWNSPTDWGPRAWQLYWQTIISWEASEFACSLVGRKC